MSPPLTSPILGPAGLLTACVALIQAVESASVEDLRAARQALETLPGHHPAGMIVRSILADQAQRLSQPEEP